MPGAQDSRKGWPEILTLGQKPWGRKIGWSRLPLLPVPAQTRTSEVPGGKEVLAKVPLPPQLLIALRTVPALPIHDTEFSRLSGLGAAALWFCLNALSSSLIS